MSNSNSCEMGESSDSRLRTLTYSITNTNYDCVYKVLKVEPELLSIIVFSYKYTVLLDFLKYLLAKHTDEKDGIETILKHKNEDDMDIFEQFCDNALKKASSFNYFNESCKYEPNGFNEMCPYTFTGLLIRFKLLIAFMKSIGLDTKGISDRMYDCMNKGGYTIGGMSSKRRKTKHNRKHKYSRSTKHKYSRSRK